MEKSGILLVAVELTKSRKPLTLVRSGIWAFTSLLRLSLPPLAITPVQTSEGKVSGGRKSERYTSLYMPPGPRARTETCVIRWCGQTSPSGGSTTISHWAGRMKRTFLHSPPASPRERLKPTGFAGAGRNDRKRWEGTGSWGV